MTPRYTDSKLEELQETVEWLAWRKACAENELHDAIQELETYRREHIPRVASNSEPF